MRETLCDNPSSESDSAPGTVVVPVLLPISVADAWRALTEPDLVAQWFGTLTGALTSGASVRLDFGDGDFFNLEVLQSAPPSLLQYTWRFLGIGPLNTITWRLAPHEHGCLATVIDSDSKRSDAAAQELHEGWLDFTRRLEAFARTGVPARYDWRRDIDASIEVPGNLEHTWQTLFTPRVLSRWLPLAGAPLVAGTRFHVPDRDAPPVLEIRDVGWGPPSRVQFRVTHPEWLRPTLCELVLTPRAQHTLISVRHTGWEGVSADADEQLHQRKRFANLWIRALFWCGRSVLAKQCSEAM